MFHFTILMTTHANRLEPSINFKTKAKRRIENKYELIYAEKRSLYPRIPLLIDGVKRFLRHKRV